MSTLAELLAEALYRSMEAKLAEAQKDFEARDVAQFENGDLHISTVRVPEKYTEGRELYQTGIAHPSYTDDDLWDASGLPNYIVVGEYESREAALDGHSAWVSVFSKPEHEWPQSLRDVCSIPAMADINGRVVERKPVDDADDDLAA